MQKAPEPTRKELPVCKNCNKMDCKGCQQKTSTEKCPSGKCGNPKDDSKCTGPMCSQNKLAAAGGPTKSPTYPTPEHVSPQGRAVQKQIKDVPTSSPTVPLPDKLSPVKDQTQRGKNTGGPMHPSPRVKLHDKGTCLGEKCADEKCPEKSDKKGMTDCQKGTCPSSCPCKKKNESSGSQKTQPKDKDPADEKFQGKCSDCKKGTCTNKECCDKNQKTDCQKGTCPSSCPCRKQNLKKQNLAAGSPRSLEKRPIEEDKKGSSEKCPGEKCPSEKCPDKSGKSTGKCPEDKCPSKKEDKFPEKCSDCEKGKCTKKECCDKKPTPACQKGTCPPDCRCKQAASQKPRPRL